MHTEVLLSTARLHLRELRPSDATIMEGYFLEEASREAILRVQRSPVFAKKYVEEHLANQEQMSKWDERGHLVLAVVRQLDQKVLGVASLVHAYERSKVAVLGWHFGSQFSGNGYATEAAEELLRFGFYNQKVFAVMSECFRGNTKARSVLTKIGMVEHRSSFLLRARLAWFYRESRPLCRYWAVREKWMKGRALGAGVQPSVQPDVPALGRAAG